MGEPGRFEKLADDASSVLRDDPELRLDVRRELLTHLEEKAEALRADGRSEAEAAELAAKAFGEPAKVAEELADSNRRRMALRGRARMVVRACVVPLAVLLASWTAAHEAARFGYITSFVNGSHGDCDHSALGPFWSKALSAFAPHPLDRLKKEDRLLFHDDTSRQTLLDRRRLIWEAHPDRKDYYAQYAIFLPTLLSDPKGDGFLQGDAGEAVWARFDAELRRGEAMDPDNALYPYLRAHPLLYQSTRQEDPALGYDSPLVVTDRGKLDRAISAYLGATRKPFFRNYAEEVCAEKLRLLGPIQRIEDQIFSIGTVAGAMFPELSQVRGLYAHTPHFASILAEEGRVEEAEEILDSWLPVLRHLNEHSFTLAEALTCRAIATHARDKVAPAFERLGKPDKAADARIKIRRILDVIIPPSADSSFGTSPVFDRHGSTLAGLTFPVFGKIAGATRSPEPNALASGRALEYLLFEQISLACLLMAAILLMLLCGWRVFTAWRRRTSGAQALLLLPSGSEAAKILALSILLPLGIYLARTRMGGFPGRELNLKTTFPVTVAELWLLAAAMIFLSTRLHARFLWSRCRTLEIPVPERAPGRPWLAALAIGVPLLWLPESWMGIQSSCAGILGFALLILSLDSLLKPFRWKRHPVYFATVARSQVPVLAAAVLLLGMIGEAAFPAAEARLLQRDRVNGPSDEVGFTRMETEIVNRFREALASALPPH